MNIQIYHFLRENIWKNLQRCYLEHNVRQIFQKQFCKSFQIFKKNELKVTGLDDMEHHFSRPLTPSKFEGFPNLGKNGRQHEKIGLEQILPSLIFFIVGQ